MRTFLDCSNCGQRVGFDLDTELDGNHEIVCTKCNHIHYRVIEKGEITGERYRSSSGPVWNPPVWTISSTATTDWSHSVYHDNFSASGTSGW